MKTIVAISKPKFLWVCGLLAACAMIFPSAGAQSVAPRILSEANSAETSVLRNSLHPLAQAQFDAGRMPAETRLNGISILFSRTALQEADLKALIAAQQNPASPFYHQWLTPEQFAARFGMSDADLSKVQSWLQQQGFSIDSVARSKNAIHFTGTARQVEQAFSTEMHFYKVSGTQSFAPSTALSVPSTVAPVVLSIQNLDSFRPMPRLITKKNLHSKFTQAATGEILFSPGDIRTAYDVTPLYNASITGAGQSITLVGQSAVQTGDLEAFQSAAGLAIKDPTQFLVPNSGDSTVNGLAPQGGDEVESDLDLEWSNAMAPGATINFVYTGNNANYGAFDSIQYAIDQQIGTIISSSYGECEAYLPQTTLGIGSSAEPALETAFEQATVQGQSIMAAAGDQGSTDCNEYLGPGTGTILTATDTTLAVDYPASSQYVTGIGGTEISQAQTAYFTPGGAYWEAATGNSDVVNSVQQYIPEVVWNDDSAQFGLSAGGGGASTLFNKPSWQTGVTGIPSGNSRYVPDLALYASPNWPGFLFCSSDTSAWNLGQESSCSSGFEDSATGDLTAAGGTSFDGPIFSGILALINQKQGYSAGQGLVNPTLYKLASNSTTYQSAFHAIQSGNNDCAASSTWCGSTTGGFSVSGSLGYSEVGGLGSIDANNLATAWPASTSISSLIDTTTTVTASNTAPNVGASDTFTVTVAAAMGTVVPTGTVNVSVDGATAIPETLSTNGTVVYTTSFSTAGSHTVFAQYAGNTVFAASPASEAGSATVEVATVSSGKGTISLSASPSSLTVAQGSNGNETITVTPAGGYTGTVDLTFDTSNDSALQNLCFEWGNENSADGTVPIASAAAQTILLNLDANASDCELTGAVRTSGKHALRSLRPVSAAKNTGSNSLPMTLAFAGLLLVGFLGRASKKLRGLAAILLLASVGLAVTACGGVVNTPFSNPPTGTYTVTVTGQDSVTSTTTATTTFTFVIN
jgi:subtilase family serine protease